MTWTTTRTWTTKTGRGAWTLLVRRDGGRVSQRNQRKPGKQRQKQRTRQRGEGSRRRDARALLDRGSRVPPEKRAIRGHPIRGERRARRRRRTNRRTANDVLREELRSGLSPPRARMRRSRGGEGQPHAHGSCRSRSNHRALSLARWALAGFRTRERATDRRVAGCCCFRGRLRQAYCPLLPSHPVVALSRQPS